MLGEALGFESAWLAESVFYPTRPMSNPLMVAVGWMTWDFDKANAVCIYDEPAACVDRLLNSQAQLPGMYPCILEFNRRGRTPSDRGRESVRLFADQVMLKLSRVQGPDA